MFDSMFWWAITFYLSLRLPSLLLSSIKYIELRRHHADSNLKSVIARADSDLYKNGFLPRTVLRKIAVDYLLMEGSSNRYYPCSSHSAPSAAILANMRNRKQPSSSLVVRTESKFRLSSYDEKLPEFRDHILRAAVIESGKIEILLDSCILDSERFHQTLYWAGEIERTKLPHTNPSLRMEFWDHTRPGEITVKMTDNPGSETSNSLSFSPEVSPQLPHRADTIFYCLDTFSRLLLIMIEKRASRYCHQNDLFVAWRDINRSDKVEGRRQIQIEWCGVEYQNPMRLPHRH